MTLAWIRFGITALFLLSALICFTGAVIGSYRFGFVMNCLHAAGIGDTLGILCVIIALIVSADSFMTGAKLFLIAAFLWGTSPVSTHFIGQAEYFIHEDIEQQFDRGGTHDESSRNH